MISLKNISKYYGDTHALENLSLEVAEGEICVLLGKSGCGKSTTLRLINKIIPATTGEIVIGGKPIDSYPVEKLRSGIGYVVQSIGLFPHMNVEKNISIVPNLLKWDKRKIKARIQELLDLVGLSANQYIHKFPSELSGGEAQRVGVARALAADPPIILMDEPFGAIDPINRTRLQKEFLKIQEKIRKTIVFVTHDIDEALRMADRIAILEKGTLLGYDRPEKLIGGEHEAVIREFLGKDYMLKLLSRFPVSRFIHRPASLDNTINILPEDATLQDALSAMIINNCDHVGISGVDGRLLGIIRMDAVSKAWHGGDVQ